MRRAEGWWRLRAVLQREFGDPGVLAVADVPDPTAGPGQVLVEVAFANITFVETQIRAGRPPNPAMAPELPSIPGNGVGGLVAAAGPGADPALVGRRVVSATGGSGAYAERVAVDAGGVIELPAGLGLDDAVALLADGRTALGLVRAAGLGRGDVVLVEAAAGGVGSLLVQLARAAGADVVAAAGGARKLALARELGAGLAVDYLEPGWEEHIRADRGGVDVVFDGVGGPIARAAFELLRPGGRMCSFGMAGGEFAAISPGDAERRGVALVRGTGIGPDQIATLTREALAEAAAGRLRPVIGQRLPLAEAAAAHAAIEARATLGKTLLVVAAR